jgi:hypothetical protein
MHEAIDPSQLVCSNCEFSHWGVWQATHESGGAAIEQTALVPYVAGAITSNTELTDTITNATNYGINAPTAVHYSGDIAANKFAGGTLSNVTGTFEAVIDLQNRQITAYAGNAADMAFGFNGTGAALTLNGASTAANTGAAVNFNSNQATFSNVAVQGIDGSINDNLTGTLNGALFGAKAQEVGGNFDIIDDNSMAGGIYLGKR